MTTCIRHLCVLLTLSLIPFSIHAQEAESGYRSQIDEDLTIRKTTLLPVSDNVGGIYARPLEAELLRILREQHRFNHSDYSGRTDLPGLDELEEDKAQMQTLGKTSGVDGMFAAKISKGPRGVSLTLDLFLSNDGKLLLQETLRDHPRFEVSEIKDKMQQLYRKLVNRLPYDGMILSRTGNKVTISLGSRDGVQTGQIVNAILVLQAQRHPKFNFLISTEKEILGKIKLLKVEDTLSFGTLLTEKDKGSIRKNTKVSGLESITYAPEPTSPLAQPTSSIPDDQREWVPTPPPTFGLVGLQLGFGTYAHKTSLDGVEAYQGRSSLYPELKLTGELWITPRLIMRGHIRQGIATFKNPRQSSSPSDLSVAVGSYGLNFGYNILMREDFWGPKITLLGGFHQYKATIDDSQPTAFTTTSYQGFNIGVEGSLPIDQQGLWSIGAGLNYIFQPTLSETPVTSGSTSHNTINQFFVTGQKKLRENLQAQGSLALESYNSSFTGGGSRDDNATSDSQTTTVLSGGINYLF